VLRPQTALGAAGLRVGLGGKGGGLKASSYEKSTLWLLYVVNVLGP